MKVVIAGAGEVGTYIAEQIAQQSHDVTVIESDVDKGEELVHALDVDVISGNASSVHVLRKAAVEKCDLFLSLTPSEEVNIVSASVARRLGAAKTIARIEDPVFLRNPSFSYQTLFGIDDMFSANMFAALEMASFIRNSGSLAVEHFAQGSVVMRQVIIDKHSRYVGKKLSELDFPADVRIVCITRHHRVLIPKGETSLQAADTAVLIGETERVSSFQKNFKWGKIPNQRIVVLGGGRIARSLARRLKANEFHLTIIEQDAGRCEAISSLLPSATVLQGNGTKLDLLTEEHVDTADYFIATTAYDEINIMSALQVKKLGAKKTLVLIRRPDFGNLIEDLGIDHAVSPRAIMAREVLTLLKKGKERSLADMGAGEVKILEIHIKNQALIGQKLKDISLSKNTLILLIKRNGEIIIPSGETPLMQHDILLIICTQSNRKKTIRLFGT